MPVNDSVTSADDTGPIDAIQESPAREAGVPAVSRSGRIAVPGRVAEPGGTTPVPGRLGRLRGVARNHRPFGIVLIAAALLRLVVMLGYPPALFFNDSYNYMTDAVTKYPDMVRANGYPFFLYLLLPFHNLNVVTGLQALMGLVMGAAIYAVLRRRGLPWWGATIPALPVLFDVFEVQLEHMIASDVLFYTLITLVLVAFCWWDRPPLWAAIVAGLAIGYAATVRTVGEPLLILFLIGMLARRMGWQRILATAVAGVVPIVAYMAWFHSFTGQYAMDEATGTFLYSRVQTFADCDRMHPSAQLAVLCDPRSVQHRENPQEYPWSNQTPLAKVFGTNNVYRFTPAAESLTMKFAELAIEKQPLDYIKAVAKDTLQTFEWTRQGTNDYSGGSLGNVEGSGSLFRFEPAYDIPFVPNFVTSATNARAAKDFGTVVTGKATSANQPWSIMLRAYQKVFYLRGPFLFLFVLVGAVGVWLGIRRKTRIGGTGWGGLGLMSWLVGVALIVLPPMTAGFSYRYVLAAVPAVCLAAGLAFVGRGSLITWLRAEGLWPAKRATAPAKPAAAPAPAKPAPTPAPAPTKPAPTPAPAKPAATPAEPAPPTSGAAS